jgi:hypothetical protein
MDLLLPLQLVLELIQLALLLFVLTTLQYLDQI